MPVSRQERPAPRRFPEAEAKAAADQAAFDRKVVDMGFPELASDYIPEPPIERSNLKVGSYVGKGAKQISCDEGEFKVDPETGKITRKL